MLFSYFSLFLFLIASTKNETLENKQQEQKNTDSKQHKKEHWNTQKQQEE